MGIPQSQGPGLGAGQKVIPEGAATGFVCCLHTNIESQGLRQPLVQAE